jgi:hypothetical protein
MNARIGFSRHKGFAPLAWLIMLVEWTPYSHAYLKFYSQSMDRWLVYEATGKGVFFKALPRFENEAIILFEYELPVPDDKRTKLMTWAVDTSGEDYGRLQAFGILFVRIGQKLGKKWKNPFQNGETRYICDELVEEALRKLGYQSSEDQDSIGLPDLKARIDNLKLVPVKIGSA